MIRSQLFVAAALIAGVAIGYFVKTEPVAASESAAAAEGPKRAVADRGEEATVRALRRRVAELERALASRTPPHADAVSNAAVAAAERPPSPPKEQKAPWRERMEELKRNDPERYVQLTNRFAQKRQVLAERARSRIDFLSSIDTSGMSGEAKRTHAALQELIAKREEIEQQLRDPNLPDEDRKEVMRELWTSQRELGRLNAEERRNLLEATATSLGFEGNDAQEFTATIQAVIEATDGGIGHRHLGGPHPEPAPEGTHGR